MISGEVLTLVITSGVVGGILGAMLKGIPFLNKKGVNVEEVAEDVEKLVNASSAVINMADTIAPNNAVISVLKTIETWGAIGAGYAQQLCYAGDINKEDRAKLAENVVYEVLKELKVDIDDNKKLFIDAAIKNTVNSFGHSTPDTQLQSASVDNNS